MRREEVASRHGRKDREEMFFRPLQSDRPGSCIHKPIFEGSAKREPEIQKKKPLN
jgi:hypothetical protein